MFEIVWSPTTLSNDPHIVNHPKKWDDQKLFNFAEAVGRPFLSILIHVQLLNLFKEWYIKMMKYH